MAFLFGGNQQMDPQNYFNLARLQGYVSNPNIIGPYGTQSVQWGQFDQAGYDAAQKKYEADLAAYKANPPMTFSGRGATPAPPPEPPKREDFTINKDQATITQALTPLGEATKNYQQLAQWNFGKAGQSAAEQAAAAMSTPFKYTGPDIKTSIDYSQAGAGPSAGLYGLQKGGVEAPQIQTALGGTPSQIQTGLDTSKLAAMPISAGTTAQQAIMSRLQPQLQQQREQLRTSLVNQGLAPGGEAYNAAMQEQSQRENDLLSQAALQGINLDMSARQQGLGEQQALGGFTNQAQQQAFNQMLQSGQFGNAAQLASFGAGLQNQQAQNQAAAGNFAQAQAAQQMANQAAGQNYQQNLGAAGFQNQAINQLLNQQLGLYNQPLSTATNLLQASAFQNPNFGTGFQSPNYGNVGTQMQNDVNAANAQRNAGIGGMMQLGGTLIGAAYGNPQAGYAAGSAAGNIFSDRRLKTNIVQVGSDPRGFGIYEYDIFGRRERGVMAQEVEKIIPDAVIEHPSGFKMVNYGAL